VNYDTVVWLPNALVMTAVLGAFAWWRWRRAGAVSGLRWTGVAMLPLALYAVGVFKLAWSVGLAFSRFVSGFVWRPSVWLGLILVAVAVALIILPSKLDPSGSGRSGTPTGRSAATKRKSTGGDDDMTEVEDILKKHGLG
jgi:hypothetical protein